MFRKFSEKDVSNVQQLKSSVQRQIKAKVVEYYPELQPYIDGIFPKKESFKIAKCQDHVELLLSSDGVALFFKKRDGAWFPTLRLLHQYPFVLAQEVVDKGAIRSVLSGANVMVPGLNAQDAKIANVPKNTIVAVHAATKIHAMGIGITLMTPEDIAKASRGVGIEVVHVLNDGLWNLKALK